MHDGVMCIHPHALRIVTSLHTHINLYICQCIDSIPLCVCACVHTYMLLASLHACTYMPVYTYHYMYICMYYVPLPNTHTCAHTRTDTHIFPCAAALVRGCAVAFRSYAIKQRKPFKRLKLGVSLVCVCAAR